MRIIEDDLSSADVAELLREHLAEMAKNSPAESIHALELPALRAPDITFWTAWDDSTLLGCGALKELDAQHGEIKSVQTAIKHRGRGVASAILSHLIEESVRRTYLQLSLETGSGPAFDPAHCLFEKFGFRYCGPFGDYADDPFSRFMTLTL
ncbi:MAG: GNAT family N-acetyltransferase [Gammaproteobacteria bacterium]|nr:GNAT family N-acetyltransferase [Gammaproteobacteria bacterium]MBT8112025.1 GNAT family N-acetyltransferase [Gammaproteobacteria bacterium]NND48118.1 GNAT family N-acetyltransferase [Woeseiaceae bacterium]NNL46726.1 GNAT family N-acetyltransferase [Woeseiaceae bacterium]